MHMNILNFPQQEDSRQSAINWNNKRNLYRLMVIGSWSTTMKDEEETCQEEPGSELLV